MRNIKRFGPKRIASASIRRFNNLGLFLPTRQFVKSSDKGPQLLVVASGSIPIPTNGWGAVERIISETLPLFESEGFSVSILNSKHKKEWSLAASQEFKIILCHDDSSIEKVKKYFPIVPLVAVTHYGSLPVYEEWDPSYIKVARSFSLANKVVALSQKCKLTLEEHTQLSEIKVCPNGLQPLEYQTNPRKPRAIYLGKIEPRKRQIEIARLYPQLEIDFVGPGKIPFSLRGKAKMGVRFLGSRDKSWLKNHLSSYDIGILISRSEADALVLYEYQNAGLKILVSDLAIGDQDSNLPWISITNLENLELDMVALRNLDISPSVISDYASVTYNWESRITPLVDVLKSCLK